MPTAGPDRGMDRDEVGASLLPAQHSTLWLPCTAGRCQNDQMFPTLAAYQALEDLDMPNEKVNGRCHKEKKIILL